MSRKRSFHMSLVTSSGLPLKEFRVDAHHERFLVVAAIEDPNAAALRHVLHTTPQKIVIEFFGRWGLEGIHLAALRVDPRHHVLDRAVFPSGIHGLEDEQHRPAILRVQHVLQLSQSFHPHGERLLGARLILGAEAKRFAGIDVLQAKVAIVGYPKGCRETSCPLNGVLHTHGTFTPAQKAVRHAPLRSARPSSAPIPAPRAPISSVYRCKDPARSKRSRFITLVHAATKSFKNFLLESAQA